MLSDPAVYAAFIESIVPGRREKVVKCRERTLRKIAQTMPTEEELIEVEDQWLKRRDGNYTLICSVFSVYSGFSGVCGSGSFRTLSSIVDFWALIGQKP